MLWIGRKKVDKINIGSKSVAILYRGAAKIWEAVRSCFGKGYWINSQPWRNGDAWKN